ncbi:hypothetical protein Q7P37_010758 [Cladosporium fusiforme]
MSRRLSAIFSNPIGNSERPPMNRNASSPAMSREPSPPQSTGRLQKAPPSHQPRASSGQLLDPNQPSLQDLQQHLAGQNDFGAPTLPPPTFGHNFSRPSSRDGSRPGTAGSMMGGGSRPQTPTLNIPNNNSRPDSRPGSPNKSEKRKSSWFGGKGKKSSEEQRARPIAWIAGHPQHLPFDHEALLQGRKVPELWDDVDGNCYIHFFPKESGKGPSFKIDSAILASSPVLTKMAFGDLYSSPAVMSGDRKTMPLDQRTQSLSIQDPYTPPDTPHRQPTNGSGSSADSRGGLSIASDSNLESHIYFPLKFKEPTDEKSKMETLQVLVDFRNFFACLCGQALIATEKRATFFHIFMTVASLLKGNEFSNADGSTYGEVASTSFDGYVEELGLADVRGSREKTIEGVVLGERMKSISLYNEAFTHAAGKLVDLTGLKSPKFELMSAITKNRLTRASMDLEQRESNARIILTDFDFPSIFSGIMSSKMAGERKEGVRFDAWKNSFNGMRKWTLATLKHRYGSWPPKAKSKKNNLETSGLQRLVLRDLYHDLCSVYDLLADRTNLTTRTLDGIDLAGPKEEPTVSGLRSALSEYDRSSPPVKPPIPFDLPLLPSLKTTRPDFDTGDKKKDQKAIGKKIKDDELVQIYRGCWNGDARATPFVNAFRDMERRAAHGCTIHELVDLRIGQWIFLYAIIQALPLLACDAPGIKHTEGVEYFLCEPPRSGVPWADPEKAAPARRNWYAVGDAGGVVSLPSDVVENGVEGVYRRSHCWQMAEQWTATNPILNTALHEHEAASSQAAQAAQGPVSVPGLSAPMASASDSALSSPYPPLRLPSPGPGLMPPGSRSSSPAANKRASFISVGLEALPLPAGVTPDGQAPTERPKSMHTVDSSKTFDAILGDASKTKKKKGLFG